MAISLIRWGKSATTRASGVAILTAGLVTASGLGALPAAADLAPPAGQPVTVTATPVATWQTNGTVLAMEITGDVLWVGGNFTSVRPPGAPRGSGEVPRKRLAAFNVDTGALLPAAPVLESPVYALPDGEAVDRNCTAVRTGKMECAAVFALERSPDSSQLFIGGDFRTVNGQPRGGVAAVDAVSGALVPRFAPHIEGGRVTALAADSDTVYVGGKFSTVNTQTRTNLAALAIVDGTLRPWAPVIDAPRGIPIEGMEVAPGSGRVAIAGSFDQVNGEPAHALTAVDATTGANRPWADQGRIAPTAMVTSTLRHGDVLYTTGLDVAGSHNEGLSAWDMTTGDALWTDGCTGASHSAAILRGVAYVGSHSHDCAGMVDGFGEQYHQYGSGDGRRYTLRAEVPAGPRPHLLHWFPSTNDGNGAYAMAADTANLWVGGEFTKVSGQAQQGLTHFRFRSGGGANHPPLPPERPLATSIAANSVALTWRVAEDPDHRSLRYQIFRDGRLIATAASSARPWLRNWMTFTDTGVQTGTVHTYLIRAVDPLGATATSPAASVRVAGGSVGPAGLPAAAAASAHYDLTKQAGQPYRDRLYGRTANHGDGITTVGSGAGPGLGAVKFSGTGALVDSWNIHGQRQASYEVVFATSSKQGGVLTSIGTSANANQVSETTNHVLYLSADGRLHFGIRPDAARPDPWQLTKGAHKMAASTSARYNDGRWHHVVATFEPGTGVRLYVDGQLAGANPAARWSRSLYGFLRIGGDRAEGWLAAPKIGFFTGLIDEVAVYDHPLTPAQVAAHAAAFRGTAAVTPSASFPTAEPVKAAQRVAGSVAKKIKRKKAKVLPVRTSAGLPLVWKSATKRTCRVARTKVRGRKAGVCRLRASAAGAQYWHPLTITVRIRVKR